MSNKERLEGGGSSGCLQGEVRERREDGKEKFDRRTFWRGGDTWFGFITLVWI